MKHKRKRTTMEQVELELTYPQFIDLIRQSYFQNWPVKEIKISIDEYFDGGEGVIEIVGELPTTYSEEEHDA